MEEDFSEEEEDSDTSDDAEAMEMEIRLGNVDFSDSGEDEEVLSSDSDSDGEESDNSDIDDEESEVSSDSDEESEGSEHSLDDDAPHHEDDDDEMFIDGTEEEVGHDEAGWDRREELFDEGEDQINDFEDPDVGNEIADDENGWTAVEAGGPGIQLPGGFGTALMDALRRQGMTGAIGRGNQGLQAVENMLSNLLREGRVQELEETLGIRVVRGGSDGAGRTSIGLRFPASSNLPLNAEEGRSDNAGATNSAIPVHQSAAPDIGYGVPALSSHRSLVEVLPMEYMYGGPAQTSNYYVSRSDSDSEQELESSPSSSNNDNSELFPGGLAASTHSRNAIVPHPLLAAIELPPTNALLAHSSQTTRQTSNSDTISGPRSAAASGTFVRTPGGGLMRVSRGSVPIDTHNRARSTVNLLAYGWTDDGVSPEQSSDGFGVLFGQALLGTNQAVQDEISARNQSTANENSNASEANPTQGNESGDANTNAGGDEAPAAAEPEVSTADSSENVDVSRLTISQQESDTHTNLSNNEQPCTDPVNNSNDEAEAEPNDEADPNDSDMPDAEDAPAEDEGVVEEPDTSSQVEEPGSNSQEHDDSDHDDSDHEGEEDEEGEEGGDAPADAEQNAGQGGLTCPPNVRSHCYVFYCVSALMLMQTSLFGFNRLIWKYSILFHLKCNKKFAVSTKRQLA
jgi:hypothetical protein